MYINVFLKDVDIEYKFFYIIEVKYVCICINSN